MVNNDFHGKTNFPITYGDKHRDEIMFSDYVVKLMKTTRFPSHITAAFFAWLMLESYAHLSSAIPTEYGPAGKKFYDGGNSKTEIFRTLNQESLMSANLNQHEPNSFRKTGPPTLQTPSGLITLGLSRGGDFQPKFGPGARAMNDARTYVNSKKGDQTVSNGASAYADAFTPSNTHSDRYHKNNNLPFCHQAHTNICPSDDQGKSLKLDLDGYCVNQKGKKFVRIEHEHQRAKFKTPANQNDPVQEANEAIGTEKSKLTTDIGKRQIFKKWKHRPLFENLDGSPIETYNEFRDSQVKFLENDKESKYVSDCMLLGQNAEPKDAVCVVDDQTQQCLVLGKTKQLNSETKAMEESPILEYIGPRTLSNNQYERFKRYGIIGSDGEDISSAKHGMRAEELIKIRSNKIDPLGDSDTCSRNEK